MLQQESERTMCEEMGEMRRKEEKDEGKASTTGYCDGWDRLWVWVVWLFGLFGYLGKRASSVFSPGK